MKLRNSWWYLPHINSCPLDALLHHFQDSFCSRFVRSGGESPKATWSGRFFGTSASHLPRSSVGRLQIRGKGKTISSNPDQNEGFTWFFQGFWRMVLVESILMSHNVSFVSEAQFLKHCHLWRFCCYFEQYLEDTLPAEHRLLHKLAFAC